MDYSFDIEVAQQYGVNEAIMIKNLQFWIMKNKANGKHFHDGHTWTYNSVAAFMQLFPFWTEKQIRIIINSLKEKGIIITGNYNPMAYDRTLWYAFDDESIWLNRTIHLSKTANGSDKKGRPIPDIKPDIKPDKKKNGSFEPSEEEEDKFASLEEWEAGMAKLKAAMGIRGDYGCEGTGTDGDVASRTPAIAGQAASSP